MASVASTPPAANADQKVARRSIGPALLEFALLVAVFAIESSWLPPDPNEAHYLCKARHFWDASWCGHDFFLNSTDSHGTFYLSLGWLTTVMSLVQAAWVGRALTWLALAWGWRELGAAILHRRTWTVLAAAGMVALNSRFHEAGEWIAGGFEAKGFAYALVFAALARAARGQWNITWLLLGAASGIHVLVGGWSTVAMFVAWLATPDAPRLKQIAGGLVGGAILSLPGVVPGILLSRGVEYELLAQASEIYVYQRLPHHLWPAGFVRGGFERFALLSCLWLAMAAIWPASRREHPLRWFVAGALGIALVGGLISFVAPWHPARAAMLLRYYWFRLADVMIPMGVAATGAASLARAMHQAASRQRASVLAAAAAVAMLVHFGLVVRDQQALGVPRADGPGKVWDYADWRGACEWILENTPREAVFLTPRSSQTFKWYAERSEVVTWKDVPQHAAEIVAWWQRMFDVYGTGDPLHRWHNSLADTSVAHLRRVARVYHADYVLTSTEPALALPCVYQNSTYTVYDLRPALHPTAKR